MLLFVKFVERRFDVGVLPSKHIPVSSRLPLSVSSCWTNVPVGVYSLMWPLPTPANTSPIVNGAATACGAANASAPEATASSNTVLRQKLGPAIVLSFLPCVHDEF